MSDWQKVYFSDKVYRAEIVKGVLEEKGLQPVILNKKDAAYHFGYYEVFVPQEEVLQAIKIIADDIRFK